MHCLFATDGKLFASSSYFGSHSAQRTHGAPRTVLHLHLRAISLHDHRKLATNSYLQPFLQCSVLQVSFVHHIDSKAIWFSFKSAANRRRFFLENHGGGLARTCPNARVLRCDQPIPNPAGCLRVGRPGQCRCKLLDAFRLARFACRCLADDQSAAAINAPRIRYSDCLGPLRCTYIAVRCVARI